MLIRRWKKTATPAICSAGDGGLVVSGRSFAISININLCLLMGESGRSPCFLAGIVPGVLGLVSVDDGCCFMGEAAAIFLSPPSARHGQSVDRRA